MEQPVVECTCALERWNAMFFNVPPDGPGEDRTMCVAWRALAQLYTLPLRKVVSF